MVECKRGDYYSNARKVYQKHHGVELDSKDFVCHTCDHNWCVEITHLFVGSHQDNMDDMTSKGRQWSKLQEEDVKQIMELKGVYSQQTIAKMFRTTRSNVAMIHSGASWKHLFENS